VKDLFEEANKQQIDPGIQAAIADVVNLPAELASLPTLTAALEDAREKGSVRFLSLSSGRSAG